MAKWSRRGFVGLMLAGVSGLTLAPDALWMPDGVTLTPLDPAAVYSFEQLVRIFADKLAESLGGSYHSSRGEQVGHGAMTQQSGVTLELPDTITQDGLDVERFIDPSVAAMRQVIGRHRPSTFGHLPVPSGVLRGLTITQPSGLSVRGLQAYDVMFDQIVTRLDVLYG